MNRSWNIKYSTKKSRSPYLYEQILRSITCTFSSFCIFYACFKHKRIRRTSKKQNYAKRVQMTVKPVTTEQLMKNNFKCNLKRVGEWTLRGPYRIPRKRARAPYGQELRAPVAEACFFFPSCLPPTGLVASNWSSATILSDRIATFDFSWFPEARTDRLVTSGNVCKPLAALNRRVGFVSRTMRQTDSLRMAFLSSPFFPFLSFFSNLYLCLSLFFQVGRRLPAFDECSVLY